MAKFPIDSAEDTQGIVDAVNYAISGPSGLGQNFSGFSSDVPVYVRPTGRQPFTLPVTTTLDPSWYLTTAISNITTVGSNPTAEILVTFTTPYAEVPFQLGDILGIQNSVAGGANPDFFNDYFYTVMDCTTTDVRMALRARLQSISVTWPAYVSGGEIYRDYYNTDISTDCNGRVSVQGAGDRVFVNAQCLLDIEYTASTASAFDVVVTVDRYKGFPNTEPGSVDYFFLFDGTPAKRTFHYNVSAPGEIVDLETVFTSIIESNLPFGYYWYLLDINFRITELVEGGIITNSASYDLGYTPSGVTAGYTGPPNPIIYTGISPVTTTGSGSGGVVDIEIYNNTAGDPYSFATNLTVVVTAGGSGYRPGDIITIPGNLIGGATPANDLTLTILRVDDPGDARPGKVKAGLRSLTAQVVKE